MNLINTSLTYPNISQLLTNWVDSKPVPELLDSVTYDLYESNNPFRKTFNETDITNKGLRVAANTTAIVSAEAFSAFANPYYLFHKVTHIPIYYQSVVDKYKNTQG